MGVYIEGMEMPQMGEMFEVCLDADGGALLVDTRDNSRFYMLSEIETPPADVRPVVLCKNCTYREVDEYGVHFCTGAMAEAPTGDDWYCACGKPRDKTAIS